MCARARGADAAAESEAVVTKERALALLEGALDGESALSVAVLRERIAVR